MSRSDRRSSYSPRARPKDRRDGRDREHRLERQEGRYERSPEASYRNRHKRERSRDKGYGERDSRRLKRLKLNERGVRGFWNNTPTPPPSPKRQAKQKVRENGRMPADDAIRLDNSDTAQNGTSHIPEDEQFSTANGLQKEIEANGPEVAELHRNAAQLFQQWLAEKKLAHAEAEKRRKQEALDNVLVGPVPEVTEKAQADYGTHMRPGEGTAMAAYVQSGKRIPRRGEVGMSADEIVKYEDLGYVMSGSRHNRMNAIRIRKENQVYTAEEKAALAMFNAEENKRKEQKILADMQRLVQQTIGGLEDENEVSERQDQ